MATILTTRKSKSLIKSLISMLQILSTNKTFGMRNYPGWKSPDTHLRYQCIRCTLYRSTSECDICENFDTNECPNIFVSTKLHE